MLSFIIGSYLFVASIGTFYVQGVDPCHSTGVFNQFCWSLQHWLILPFAIIWYSVLWIEEVFRMYAIDPATTKNPIARLLVWFGRAIVVAYALAILICQRICMAIYVLIFGMQ